MKNKEINNNRSVVVLLGSFMRMQRKYEIQSKLHGEIELKAKVNQQIQTIL